MNPELAFEALHTNYMLVGTVIRTSIDFGLFFGPGVVLMLILYGAACLCTWAVDTWRDRRQRRASVMRRFDEFAKERAAARRLETPARIDDRPGTDRDALKTCLAMWEADTTDTREEETK